MISNLLKTLEKGFGIMKVNTNLLFIGVLVFVFPLLFLYVSEEVHQAAFQNIETVEKSRVGILQDSLAAVAKQNPSTTTLASFVEPIRAQNTDIIEIRVVEKSKDGYVILYSYDSANIGSIEKKTAYYDSYAAPNGDSLIFETFQGTERIWNVVRKVETDTNVYFILSNHSFAKIDKTMAARKNNTYLQLSIIFIFLLVVAYWLSRQINWHRRYQALATTLEERDLFTNMIAHEFRAPLTVINGYVSFLKESKALHPAERRFVDNIDISAKRQLALVNDFLEVARIQSGKLELDLKTLDVTQIIQSVIDANQLSAKQKGLTLSVVKPEVNITHTLDEKRFFQVIQNLVTNAIKYTEKGSVEISLEETPLAVTIRIKDTGMGIAAEDQQKLFQPFARVGGVEKTNITGTGLGMWITKQMITLMNGTISIESIKGLGTHVVVTLKR